MSREVLTPEDVADRWGCSASHVRNLINRGDLPHFRLGGKLLRVPLRLLEEWECQSSGCNGSKEGGQSPNTATGNGSRAIGLKAAMRQERLRSSGGSRRRPRAPSTPISEYYGRHIAMTGPEGE
jgi:excisionase family DNA binding protein